MQLSGTCVKFSDWNLRLIKIGHFIWKISSIFFSFNGRLIASWWLTIRMICDSSNPPFQPSTFESRCNRSRQTMRHWCLWLCGQAPGIHQISPWIFSFSFSLSPFLIEIGAKKSTYQEMFLPSHKHIITFGQIVMIKCVRIERLVVFVSERCKFALKLSNDGQWVLNKSLS